MMATGFITTPLGPMTATVRQGVLLKLAFSDAVFPSMDAAFFSSKWTPGRRMAAETMPVTYLSNDAADWSDVQALERLTRSLAYYFSGEPFDYGGPILLYGCTSFQEQVLRLTGTIPHGDTLTYGELARRMGRPRAAQAVGVALSKNPLLILFPCHRVVPAGGSVGGYCAGSWRKAALLQLEKATSW